MSFHSFYDSWLDQLKFFIHHLNNAPKYPATKEDHRRLRDLVKKVVNHYEEYYKVKLAAVAHDVLAVFTAPWCTSLERSLLWIAGWRPTTAFHLVYTESSILFETNMADIFRGCRTGDLGDLSPAQFRRVSELQCETVQLENSIAAELSDWQDSTSELIGVKGDVDDKMEGLMKIVTKADELRLRTIKTVVDLLTPQQAAEFVVAAAELQFGVHSWGTEQDRSRA